MNDKRIAELLEICEAATEGPWRMQDRGEHEDPAFWYVKAPNPPVFNGDVTGHVLCTSGWYGKCGGQCEGECDCAPEEMDWSQEQRNAEFAIHARTALPEALAALVDARLEVVVLELALEKAAADARRYHGQAGSMENMTVGGYKYKARKEVDGE